MTGTAGNLKATMPLSGAFPALTGPFWGNVFFFAGAWTIGIFKFWGPVLAGGFSDMNGSDVVNGKQTTWFTSGGGTAPANSWTWNWWFAFLGAGFLTYGAWIFAKMGNSVGDVKFTVIV